MSSPENIAMHKMLRERGNCRGFACTEKAAEHDVAGLFGDRSGEIGVRIHSS